MFGLKFIKESDYDELLTSNDKLNSQIANLENELKGRDLKISDLNDEITDLASEIASLRTENANLKVNAEKKAELLTDVAETPLTEEKTVKTTKKTGTRRVIKRKTDETK